MSISINVLDYDEKGMLRFRRDMKWDEVKRSIRRIAWIDMTANVGGSSSTDQSPDGSDNPSTNENNHVETLISYIQDLCVMWPGDPEDLPPPEMPSEVFRRFEGSFATDDEPWPYLILTLPADTVPGFRPRSEPSSRQFRSGKQLEGRLLNNGNDNAVPQQPVSEEMHHERKERKWFIQTKSKSTAKSAATEESLKRQMEIEHPKFLIGIPDDGPVITAMKGNAPLFAALMRRMAAPLRRFQGSGTTQDRIHPRLRNVRKAAGTQLSGIGSNLIAPGAVAGFSPSGCVAESTEPSCELDKSVVDVEPSSNGTKSDFVSPTGELGQDMDHPLNSATVDGLPIPQEAVQFTTDGIRFASIELTSVAIEYLNDLLVLGLDHHEVAADKAEFALMRRHKPDLSTLMDIRMEVGDIRETLVGLDRYLSFIVPMSSFSEDRELREDIEYVHEQIDSLLKRSVRLIDDMRHLIDLFMVLQSEESTRTQERIARNVGKLTIVTLAGAIMGTTAGVFGMNTIMSSAPLLVPYEASFLIIVSLSFFVILIIWRMKWLRFS